jgi:hypothetical protein
LPAGKYIVSARILITNSSGVEFNALCHLSVSGSNVGTSYYHAAANVPAAKRATLPIIGQVDVVSGPAVISGACGTPPAGVTVSVGMTAIQVQTLH